MGRFMQPVMVLPTRRSQSCRYMPIEGLLAGLLGGLPSHSLFENERRRGWFVLEPSLRHTAIKQPWIQVLNMTGFKPEEIDVKVKDNVISINAQHEEVNGGNVDIVKRKRTVDVPQGVNLKKVACFIHRGGNLVIQAPFSTTSAFEGKKNSELQTGTEQNSAKHNGDESQHQQNCHTLKEPTFDIQTNDAGNHTQGQRDTLKEFEDTKIKTARENLKCQDHFDTSKVNVHSSPENTPDALLLEQKSSEKQQMRIERLNSKEPIDVETKDCQQTNVIDDMLSCPRGTNTVGPLSKDRLCRGDSTMTAPLVEEIEGDSHSGINDVETDTSLTENKSLRPSKETTAIVEKNGKKYFCAKLNLETYPVDNIRVLCEDKTLTVEAKHEWDDTGVSGFQEFLRKYPLPNNALADEAVATISDSGYFTVNVPIKEDGSQ